MGKSPDPLCYIYGTMEDIGSIIDNLEGEVIKTLLIGAPKLLGFPVCPASTFFISRRGCHAHPAWVPRVLKAGFMTACMLFTI